MDLKDILATHAAPKAAPKMTVATGKPFDEDKGERRFLVADSQTTLAADVAALFSDAPVEPTDLRDLARRYRELEASSKEAAEAAAEASALFQNASNALREGILLCGLDSIRTEWGTFTPTTKIRARIVGDDEVAFAWLEDHELGALIKRTVNAATLSSEIKRLRDEGAPLPDCFEVYEQPGLSARKAK
jgi:hypothetical protein